MNKNKINLKVYNNQIMIMMKIFLIKINFCTIILICSKITIIKKEILILKTTMPRYKEYI